MGERERERDGYLISIVFLMSCDCKWYVVYPHGAVGGYKLCVVVVFLDHIHLLLNTISFIEAKYLCH